MIRSELLYFTELPRDSNGHLESHWLLHTGTEDCEKMIHDTWNNLQNNVLREITSVSKKMAQILFKNSTACRAICLERGTPAELIPFPIPKHIYTGEKDLAKWLLEDCQAVEAGFISYNENPATIYWISSNNGRKRIKVRDLLQKEQNTAWINTFLGHEFEIVDNVNGKVLLHYIAEYNSFRVIGDSGSMIRERLHVEEGIAETLRSEWYRSRKVRRTFTELGFNKGRLPYDLWGSILSYYYNNHNNKVREEWETKGFFVNWWEVDAYMIGMPWGLKGYWQTRLRALVEKWIGGNITLENTDIYGMRRYEDGARLVSHVDREATHATSLIINVAQEAIREPWHVEIYDHADRLHEIEMNPGDIVYYESAKALHGRMKPLQGAYYVNLFAHYRPAGDPEWYLKPNPEGTPAPAIDLGEACDDAEGGTEECKTHPGLRTLSPSGHVVRGPTDLFEYWKSVSPKTSNAKKQKNREEL